MSDRIKKFLTGEQDPGQKAVCRYPEEHYGAMVLTVFFSVTVFFIYHRFSLVQMGSPQTLPDIIDHANTAASIVSFRSLLEAWLQRPYLMWFLVVRVLLFIPGMPLAYAAAQTNAIFGMVCYWVTFFLLSGFSRAYTGRDHTVICAVGTFSSCILGPIYLPWFNAYQYEGQFSINPLFNATFMASKFSGILAFMVMTDLILRKKGKPILFFAEKRSTGQLYGLFSGFLFLGVFAKPTFVFMLLPSGALYLLIQTWIGRIGKSGKDTWSWAFLFRLLLACMPAFVYLIMEFIVFYFWGDPYDSHIALGVPFLTWRWYTSNVVVSVFLGMLFPIWMVVSNFSYFWQSVEGRLAVICYMVGMLEFALFIETGDKLLHLNFSWEYMSGMLVLFLISIAKLITLTYNKKDESRREKVIVVIGWSLLFLQVFSGIYYLNSNAYFI